MANEFKIKNGIKFPDDTVQTTAAVSGNISWTIQTSAYTANAGDYIIADTTGGAFTITLPSSPTQGSAIKVADGGDWGINNLTIARNASTIEGTTEDLTCDIGSITVDLIYDGTTWQVYANTGPSGVDVEDDTTTNATVYPMWSATSSGNVSAGLTTSKLYFNPSTGVFTATDLNSLSDLTLKDNIQPLQEALSLVRQLEPVSFDWRDTGSHAYGVIAQDIEQVLPSVVQQDPQTQLRAVSYTQLVPLLIQAVKELADKIEKRAD